MLAVLAWMLSLAPISVQSVEAANQIGTFRPAPALSLYLVKDQPGKIRLRVGLLRGPDKDLGDHVMVRVFDPKERLVFRKHFDLASPRRELLLGAREIEGLKYDMRFGTEPEHPDRPWAQMMLKLEKSGIYQVRVTAGSRNTFVSMKTPKPMDYGVSFQNGTFSHWKTQPQDLWAFVPPRAERLTIRGKGLQVDPDHSQAKDKPPKLDWLDASSNQKKTMSVDEDETLWRFQMNKDGSFQAWGFPLILCNTRSAAQAIEASVEKLPDGTVLTHKFQREIYQRLRNGLLASQRIGELDQVLPEIKPKHRQAMMDDALRASILVNPRRNFFRQARMLLKAQNTNPDSHWAGSFSGWEQVAQRTAPENRWDRYRVIKPLRFGLSDGRGDLAPMVAWLCTELDEPWNPYYGNEKIINRLIAGGLAELLRLGESERFPQQGNSPYPGGRTAFLLYRKIALLYGRLADHMDKPTHDLWTRALEHIIDRSYPDTIVSTRNQSAHYLTMFQQFAQGSDDPYYEKLSRDYGRRFLASQSQAGYFEESAGPDATYIGMTHWHMAEYLRHMDNAKMATKVQKSLAASYRFFNHTVGPEPDGTIRGGFNFNHRTASGFYHEQFDGARHQLPDEIPGVALWTDARKPARRQQHIEKVREKIRKGLKNDGDRIPTAAVSEILIARYETFGKQPMPATWPAMEDESYVRNFGDELIAVRRPGYFASIYVGTPASEWYIRKRKSLYEPYPNNEESNGGVIGGYNHKPQTPLLGGGLTLLHSPQYGSAILATNWSPLTYHGPVLVRSDQTRRWADYEKTTFDLSQQRGRLTVNGKIEDTPLQYQRRYLFEKDALVIDLRLKATGDIQCKRLFENIPLALGTFKSNGANLTQGDGRTVPTSTPTKVDRLKLRDKAGNGFDLVFDQTRTIVFEPDGLTEKYRGKSMRIGRIQIMLPSGMKEADQARIRYRLMPVTAR